MDCWHLLDSLVEQVNVFDIDVGDKLLNHMINNSNHFLMFSQLAFPDQIDCFIRQRDFFSKEFEDTSTSFDYFEMSALSKYDF